VLKTGGVAYIQSHACFPLHDEPWDFWRFSQDSWAGIFNDHTGFEIIEKGRTMRCKIAHEWSAISHLEPSFDGGISHALTACLVRKTGPAKVRWEAEASDVYNLAYDH
jgi:hypothetical protein